MGCHIEWKTPEFGVLRMGLKFEQYGDKYDLSGVVIRNVTIVTFEATTSRLCYLETVRMVLRERENLRRILYPLGVRLAVWDRRDAEGREKRRLEFAVTKPSFF